MKIEACDKTEETVRLIRY